MLNFAKSEAKIQEGWNLDYMSLSKLWVCVLVKSRGFKIRLFSAHSRVYTSTFSGEWTVGTSWKTAGSSSKTWWCHYSKRYIFPPKISQSVNKTIFVIHATFEINSALFTRVSRTTSSFWRIARSICDVVMMISHLWKGGLQLAAVGFFSISSE